MSDKNEIVLGAGEVYMMKFTGAQMPEENTIEAEANNVGHCSGGFTVDYKPTKYDVKNQYEQIVKSFITNEEITAKTGILTWKLVFRGRHREETQAFVYWLRQCLTGGAFPFCPYKSQWQEDPVHDGRPGRLWLFP